MPRLSFILPVYRKEHILEKCIKSLISQSLKDWDAVFVLDGPSDESRNIIKRVMKGHPHQVVEIDHSGACRARNYGFNFAKGDFVIFWDSDCLIEPDTAKMWVETFDSRKEIDFIYSGYKFLGEQGGIPSEPFDPWTLRVRNYISSCFPIRREKVVRWNETLRSLQDWDFWLTVVENGGKGLFVPGYAFSTELPSAESISGQGCTKEAWLERIDAVKKLHNLPERDVCVSSIQHREDGIALAKIIGADYQDVPNWKPHRYKAFIQVGFSLLPGRVETHARIFGERDVRKFLFWTGDNINEIYRMISFEAISKYSMLLNSSTKQFVEDITAKNMMEKAGFNVEVLPMPLQNLNEPEPLPGEPIWAVDICPEYGPLFEVADGSLPDIKLERLTGKRKASDYTGILHFYLDRTMNNTIKRMILTGRHVISNVKAPFAGYVNDQEAPERILSSMVDKVRFVSELGLNTKARDYYASSLDKSRLMEALK